MLQILKNIWMILTLDCQGSAELTSESFDRKLHWSEFLAVKLHCLICAKSRKLNKQLRILDRQLNNSLDETAQTIRLSEAAKRRMARKLEEARH